MLTNIIDGILAETQPTPEEKILLLQALQAVEEESKAAKIHIEKARWMAIGVHMAALLRRAARGEALDEIDAAAAAEIRSEFREMGRRVLEGIGGANTSVTVLPEVLLLALHFQCAKEGF